MGNLKGTVSKTISLYFTLKIIKYIPQAFLGIICFHVNKILISRLFSLCFPNVNCTSTSLKKPVPMYCILTIEEKETGTYTLYISINVKKCSFLLNNLKN